MPLFQLASQQAGKCRGPVAPAEGQPARPFPLPGLPPRVPWLIGVLVLDRSIRPMPAFCPPRPHATTFPSAALSPEEMPLAITNQSHTRSVSLAAHLFRKGLLRHHQTPPDTTKKITWPWPFLDLSATPRACSNIKPGHGAQRPRIMRKSPRRMSHRSQILIPG